MIFESAAQAAERLNCTVRAIQKWAKEGKLPGAYKDGRDWKIPPDACRPGEGMPIYYPNEPYPLVHLFQPGKALAYVESIEDPDDRAMALCEYYYMIGELKECSIITEPYLDSPNPILRSTAAVFCLFSNLCRGHLNKSQYAHQVLQTEYERLEDATVSNELKALNVLSSTLMRMQLHLDLEEKFHMVEYTKYLDRGLRLMACYTAAYRAYHKQDYARSLGIVETALSLDVNHYPVPRIYLYIIAAMDLMNLMRVKDAELCMEEAWRIAEPDGFVFPFVEHYSLLQGLIEKRFKKNHPDTYQKILSFANQYNENWYRVYNWANQGQLPKGLTQMEFTIAMLYSRNWRAKEIAAHVGLSERTIMNYIAAIYDKLQINGKKDLERFMLK